MYRYCCKKILFYLFRLLLLGIQPVLSSSTTSEGHCENALPQGWALKIAKSNTRFNDEQKAYLNDMFDIGQETGHKLDPGTVARNMRYAKDCSGKRRFSISEFLTPKQVRSYFSRRAAKIKNKPEESDENEAAAEEQDAYFQTRSLIINECQLVHPVVFDTYNLCRLSASNGLKKLSISLLQSICEHFDIDISGITIRRKDPYIKLISDMVKSCSCSK